MVENCITKLLVFSSLLVGNPGLEKPVTLIKMLFSTYTSPNIMLTVPILHL